MHVEQKGRPRRVPPALRTGSGQWARRNDLHGGTLAGQEGDIEGGTRTHWGHCTTHTHRTMHVEQKGRPRRVSPALRTGSGQWARRQKVFPFSYFPFRICKLMLDSILFPSILPSTWKLILDLSTCSSLLRKQIADTLDNPVLYGWYTQTTDMLWHFKRANNGQMVCLIVFLLPNMQVPHITIAI